MPPDPEEFLQQADALAGNSSATQVDLRRAISAAYYAVFHFCLAAGTDMILGAGASASARYSIVYRSVDHARLRGLCEQLKVEKTHKDLPIVLAGGYGKMADFARLAGSLYEQRISADYDPSKSYTAAEVKVVISQARLAIVWFRYCTPEQQEAFLTMLLFKQRNAPAP